MRPKFLSSGTLAGGAVLFLWSFVWHGVLPFSDSGMHEFTGNQAIVDTVRANAPTNGIYISPQGIFASVFFSPSLSDQMQVTRENMAVEFLIDCVVAFLLCLLLVRTRERSTAARAGFLGVAALAAGVNERVSEWNWYGFPPSFVLAAMVETLVGWVLAGIVLSIILKRMAPSTRGDCPRG